MKADSVPSLEDKEEAKKKGGDGQQAISHKRQAVNGKQEKKESVKHFEKSKDEKPVKKEPSRKTAKKEKMGNIDKKLEEILRI